MKRFGVPLGVVALMFALPATAQAPASPPGAAVPGPAATPSDYILLTVIMRHDQTMNLDEINKI